MSTQNKVVAEYTFEHPVSDQVRAAANKLAEGLAACAEAMSAPDGEEIFDVVLAAAGSFFAIGPLTKQERRGIVARFDQAIRAHRERGGVVRQMQ